MYTERVLNSIGSEYLKKKKTAMCRKEKKKSKTLYVGTFSRVKGAFHYFDVIFNLAEV